MDDKYKKSNYRYAQNLMLVASGLCVVIMFLNFVINKILFGYLNEPADLVMINCVVGCLFCLLEYKKACNLEKEQEESNK